MESTVIRKNGQGRLGRLVCDVMGVLLGLLFLGAGLFLLYGTAHYIASGGHVNSAIGCALGAVALLFLSICLVIPTKLYEDSRLRIAGQLAVSMTSAITVAAAVLPVVFLVLEWVMEPPSPGSSGSDIGGLVVLSMVVVGLAGILLFLPCTLILARKAKPRLAHLATGTAIVGVVGGLLGYLCY